MRNKTRQLALDALLAPFGLRVGFMSRYFLP